MSKPKLEEKRWKPEHELEIQDKWKEEKIYSFDEDTDKEIMVIDNPPTYPSGTKELPIHPAQTISYTYIDMMARSARMQGKEVLFPHCFDRNGIKIERRAKEEMGKTKKEIGREEFNQKCKELLNNSQELINEIFYRCGLSFQEKEGIYYETDQEEYRYLTQKTFKKLWDKELIYEDYRPNNWCPKCETTIADAELDYKEGSTTLYYLKFKLPNGEEKEIATTRPELLGACQAVLVHPTDERYKELHNEKIKVPLYEKEVPIKPHHEAKQEFGSGMVMICSYGDKTDVKLFRELELKPIKAINRDREMTDKTGKYAGKKIEEARKEIVKDLEEKNVITKKEQITHKKPVCEACGAKIELVMMNEWYLNQKKFLNKIKEKTDEMNFLQPQHKKRLLDWINSVTIDWVISRRNYYATEIPMWYCQECKEPIVPEIDRYYKPWKEEPPIKECPKCGGKEFKGEKRVFDTWMDSSISNLYVAGYDRKEELYNKVYPEKIIRPQGRDIIRTWLYYTTLKNIQITGEKPFGKIWVHGMGLNEKGEEMSKSKGNFKPTKPLIEEHGADAVRYWAASEANIGEDYKVSEQRIRGAKKFLTKLWNTARFVSMFEQKQKPEEINPADEWILGELNKIKKEAKEGYEKYNFFPVATKVKSFIQNEFASHYLEMVKSKAYDGDKATLNTLHTVLRELIRIIAPIAPHITDKIHRELYNGSVHKETFPKIDEEKETKYTDLTEAIVEFNHRVWKKKKDKKISLSAEIEGIKIPQKLTPFKEDLKEMHNIKE
ncbi:MAG: valine--tRNA ligase [archaeon]